MINFFRKFSQGIAWLTLLLFVTGPFWSKFIEAWIEQNNVFDDPNSLIINLINLITDFFSQPWVTHLVVALIAVLIVFLCLKFYSNHRNNKAEKTSKGIDDLIKILSIIKRVIDKCNKTNNPNMNNQRASLKSLNMLLKKTGYSEIDFIFYNQKEKEFLEFIHEEISVLADDGHTDEALSTAKELFEDANNRLDRIDRGRPIRWIVDEDGLYCPTMDYFIAIGRIHETTERFGFEYYDWPLHLSEKTWFELGPFVEKYKPLLEKSEQGIDDEKYRRTIELAIRNKL